MVQRHLFTAAAAAAAVLLAGCGASGTVVGTLTKAGPPSTAAAPSVAPTTAAPRTPAPTTPPPKAAGIGATLTVQSGYAMDNSKSVLALTFVRIVDPASSSNSFDAADPGQRIVAVELRAKNIGSATIDEFADNCAVVRDAAGHSFDTAIHELALGSQVDLSHMLPGDIRDGFVAFDVPEGVTLSQLDFVPNSGFGDDTARWSLGGSV
jgi:hypothetical protein